MCLPWIWGAPHRGWYIPLRLPRIRRIPRSPTYPPVGPPTDENGPYPTEHNRYENNRNS